MTDMIVIGIFKLIQWASIGILYLCILGLLSIPFLWLVPNGSNKKWLKFKTLDEYWTENPTSKTNDGTKCNNCGSRNIRQYGYESRTDTKRYHQCNQCNMVLYRTGNKQ